MTSPWPIGRILLRRRVATVGKRRPLSIRPSGRRARVAACPRRLLRRFSSSPRSLANVSWERFMRRTLVPVVPERGLRRVWSAFAVLTTAPLATPAFGQAGHADSLKADSLRRFTLEPIAVSATRSDLPLTHTPNAVHLLDRSDISFGRPTMGPDEALAQVPRVYAANRYNYSVDQRISIRGFGA